MSRVFTKDHITVIKVLGKEIPKRPALATSEISKLGFKSKGDKADRTVRNAYRKLRAQELIEITDRGMYRLTPSGAAMAKKIAESGDTAFTQAPEKAAKKPVKKAAKAAKAVKKPVKKAAKVATKEKKSAKVQAKTKTTTKTKTAPAKVSKAPEKKETTVKAASAEKSSEKATDKVKPSNGSNGRSALEKLRGAAKKSDEKVASPTLPVV